MIKKEKNKKNWLNFNIFKKPKDNKMEVSPSNKDMSSLFVFLKETQENNIELIDEIKRISESKEVADEAIRFCKIILTPLFLFGTFFDVFLYLIEGKIVLLPAMIIPFVIGVLLSTTKINFNRDTSRFLVKHGINNKEGFTDLISSKRIPLNKRELIDFEKIRLFAK